MREHRQTRKPEKSRKLDTSEPARTKVGEMACKGREVVDRAHSARAAAQLLTLLRRLQSVDMSES